jgi:hypothetical protein
MLILKNIVSFQLCHYFHELFIKPTVIMKAKYINILMELVVAYFKGIIQAIIYRPKEAQ